MSFCVNCEKNDGMCYTSNPPKYKCTIDNSFHDGMYGCNLYDKGYQQGRADALTIDMDKPMHFTDEQKAWIKNYIIINAKRQRADAIDEYSNKLFNVIEKATVNCKLDFTIDDLHNLEIIIKGLAEELKEQTT